LELVRKVLDGFYDDLTDRLNPHLVIKLMDACVVDARCRDKHVGRVICFHLDRLVDHASLIPNNWLFGFGVDDGECDWRWWISSREDNRVEILMVLFSAAIPVVVVYSKTQAG
jgi:hypothetical protein